MKKKRRIWLLILCIILLIWGCWASYTSGTSPGMARSSLQSQDTKKSTTTASQSSDNKTSTEMRLLDAVDTSDYQAISDDLLFEFGEYLAGEKVLTVITVTDVSRNYLSARTDNNDSMWFSINCYFDGKNLKKLCKENDILTIAGVVQEKGSVGKTVSLKDCAIVGMGELAPELKESRAEQRNFCISAKVDQELASKVAAQSEKDAYINSCETVNYTDVERDPDKFDGTKVKISGKVIQVSEGWFDSVTMRVSCNGNIWYVTYTREEGENRILENDTITAYGECSGIKSYTSIAGSQVTIPSMKMEYYVMD